MLTRSLFTAASILFLDSLSGQAQAPRLPLNQDTNRITYSNVVTVGDSISSAELYSRGREWFVKTYNSAGDVIQMDDGTSGKIIGKAMMPVYWKALGTTGQGGHISYTIALYFKDGRFKYEITDFVHKETNYENGRTIETACELMIGEARKQRKKVTDGYLTQLDTNIKALILDFSKFLRGETTPKNKDDW